MEKKLIRIMAEVFDVSEKEINDDSSPHTISSWDSLTHINLILVLQKEFKIVFEDEEIPTMVNFMMISNTIKSYVD